MSQVRWRQVQALFEAALREEPARRGTFLVEACGEDLTLAAEVERLLARDAQASRDDFLWAPAWASRLREPTAARPAESREAQPWPSIPGYELLSRLGGGGMGVVYKARQLSLSRVVALKMIRPEVLEGPGVRALFRREADLVASLRHDHVVQVHDWGEHEGRPYFAMELVGGGSLQEKLLGGPLPGRDAAGLVRKLALAMHFAHGQGIVHRDLKPGNVLFDDEGEPHVTDFGLAKHLDNPASLIQSGAVVGTPPYMAPEQALGRNREIGPATDVYALGAVLYECLAGRPPFRAAALQETLLQVVHEEPVSPRRLNPAIDRDLETICLKCLRKEPGSRYGSAADLAEDLRRFHDGEPIAVRPVGMAERGWRWCRRNPAVAGLLGTVAAVVLVGAGVATGLALHANGLASLYSLAAADAQDKAEQAWTAEGSARTSEQKAKDALANAEEEKDLKVRQLMTTQLLRVAGLFERDPGQARMLLHDVNACPIDKRDAAWGFYERSCSRWEIATLRGHTASVSDMAFSPDGLTLASCSPDKTVRLWDVQTGQTKTTLSGPISWVNAVAFSPDGLTLATGSQGAIFLDKWPVPGEVRLWDAKTGQHKTTLRGHTGAVFSVAFSPDGLTLASGSNDKTVRLWDAKTGQAEAILSGHTNSVFSVAFSPDGRSLASASQDRTVRLWDVRAVPYIATLTGHSALVPSVAFSPDNLTVASGSWDQTVRLWDAKTGQHKATLHQGHTSGVHSVAFCPDGQTLASGSYDQTVRIWDLKTGETKATLQGHPGGVWAVAFNTDGMILATGSGDGSVWLWDAKTGQHKATLSGHTGVVRSVAFSPDGQTLASGSDDKTVRLWDTKTGQAKATLSGHTNSVSSLAYGPDGLILASGSRDQTVILWDLKTGQSKATLQGHTADVNSVAFSPDGLILASGSWDHTVRLWEVKTGQYKATLHQGHTGSVRSVAFSPDGRTLASGSQDKTVRLWDVNNAQFKAALPGHTGGVDAVAFSPDSQTLASGSSDQSVRLWDVKTAQVKATLQGHTGAVNAVAFSPDGQTLASGTGSFDAQGKALPGEVWLWDVKTGQHRAPLSGHTGSVRSVAYSPDGLTLATGSQDKTVRLWDAKTGQHTATLRGHLHTVTSVAYSPDGLTLATGSGVWDSEQRRYVSGEVRLWDTKTRQHKATLQGHADVVTSVAFSPDGLTLATGSDDRSVRLWDARTGQARATLQGHTGFVRCVAFSPDGLSLAAGSGTWDEKYNRYLSGEVRLWDIKPGQGRAILRGHTERVESVAFTADGQRVFGWDVAGNARAWSVADGKTADPTNPPDVSKERIAISPDGTLRAQACGAGVVLLDLSHRDSEQERAERLALEPVNRVWWHQRQAVQAEKEGDWFAAAFHRDQLLKDKPNHPGLLRLRNQALDKLKPPTPMEPLLRP